MQPSPERRQLRARIAGTLRHNPTADVSDTRRELKFVGASEYIRSLVDTAPPLSSEQRYKLATLLMPASVQEAA